MGDGAPSRGALPLFLEAGDDTVTLNVKAVPGASRDEIKGPIGEHLKIRVAAPPEGGKANKAIIALLARTLGCSSGDIELLTGASAAVKRFRISGVTAQSASQILSQ